eukprot:TRINITY_DN2490_c0_g1_i5.p2 TRINITY_DN2490_c0_g1~~TRINITY_DN2490_c0_g1_i5.p2  ORF type:complete len:502 (-),score=122.93 TRINITY_DN2490_c0_g1_i5:144-1649(-)
MADVELQPRPTVPPPAVPGAAEPAPAPAPAPASASADLPPKGGGSWRRGQAVKEGKSAVAIDTNPDEVHQNKAFGILVAFFQAFLLVLYFTCTTYGNPDAGGTLGNVSTYYTFEIDVAFMIFIGFGYLMSFLKRYGYGAPGLNWVASAFCIQWSILAVRFAEQVHAGEFHKIELTVVDLVNGLFGAAACMITFGAVIGKTSPFQMMLVFFIEIILYAVNIYICIFRFRAIDIGGSIVIHTFGAYFGVALAWVLGRNIGVADAPHKYAAASYTGDMFATIGSIFLFILWPSFNGALAPPHSQFRVVINTSLALYASSIGAFVASQLLRKDGRFDMVHVQNSTLAGGVAVGSASDLVLSPGGAFSTGLAAGVLSVIGYIYIMPFLQRTISLHDSCGVHNLHGMPGLLGGIVSAIAVSGATQSVYGVDFNVIFGADRTPHSQAGYQMAALVVTACIGMVGGFLTGFLLRLLPGWTAPGGNHMIYPKGHFEDSEYWEVPPDYKSH